DGHEYSDSHDDGDGACGGAARGRGHRCRFRSTARAGGNPRESARHAGGVQPKRARQSGHMIRKQPARYDPGSVLPGAGSERMLVDGTEAAGVSTLDRGLHFGDGLFETIACRAGRPRFLSLHLERLMSGCKRLQIAFHDEAAVRSEVEELAHGSDRALVKVLVTRGSAVARGYGFTGREKATRITI